MFKNTFISCFQLGRVSLQKVINNFKVPIISCQVNSQTKNIQLAEEVEDSPDDARDRAGAWHRPGPGEPGVVVGAGGAGNFFEGNVLGVGMARMVAGGGAEKPGDATELDPRVGDRRVE